ncbi:DNA-directed RNA polymerase II subunit 7-like [Brassica napus]|nr:DNA-directed RNA polymerase II subunit 7-like [Brassica napus]
MSITRVFFHIVLERNMQLHPRFFGQNLRENLVSKLIKDVEGTISGRHGFVSAVTGIESIGKGLIRDGTPFVTFPVKYRCVVFRPFEGEVLEAVVTRVVQNGFFAEAGPLQLFVFNHEMPDGMEYQAGDMPNYTSSDASVRIQKECEVLLKITTVSFVANEIFCLGSIKGKILGLLDDRA